MNKNPDLTRIFNDIGRAKEETASGIVEERRKMEEERKKKLQESITGSKPRDEFKDIDDLSEIERKIDEALAAAKRGTPIFNDFEFDDDMEIDDDFIIKKPAAEESMFEFNFEDELAQTSPQVIEEVAIPTVEPPEALKAVMEDDTTIDSDVMSFDLDFGDEVSLEEPKKEALLHIEEPTLVALTEEPAIEFEFDDAVEDVKKEQDYFIGTFIEETPVDDNEVIAEANESDISFDFEPESEIVSEETAIPVSEVKEPDEVEFDFDIDNTLETSSDAVALNEMEIIEEVIQEEITSDEIEEFIFDYKPVIENAIPVVESEVVEPETETPAIEEPIDIGEDTEIILESDDDVFDFEFEDEFIENSDRVKTEVISGAADKKEKQTKTAHGYLSVKTDDESGSVGYAYLLVCHDGSSKIFGKGSHGIDESGALFDCAAGLIDETIKAGQDELYIHAERKFYKKLALEDIPGDSEENKARFMNYIAKASECAKFVNIKITDKILGEDVLHSFKVDEIATFSAKK